MRTGVNYRRSGLKQIWLLRKWNTFVIKDQNDPLKDSCIRTQSRYTKRDSIDWCTCPKAASPSRWHGTSVLLGKVLICYSPLSRRDHWPLTPSFFPSPGGGVKGPNSEMDFTFQVLFECFFWRAPNVTALCACDNSLQQTEAGSMFYWLIYNGQFARPSASSNRTRPRRCLRFVRRPSAHL